MLLILEELDDILLIEELDELDELEVLDEEEEEVEERDEDELLRTMLEKFNVSLKVSPPEDSMPKAAILQLVFDGNERSSISVTLLLSMRDAEAIATCDPQATV